jgi:hypothetical protein
VVEALNSVAFWVAKLPAQGPAPGPIPGLAPELEVLHRQRGPRQGTKRRQAQVDAEDLLQAQILGENVAIRLVEPVLGRGKRVKITKKS